jgi:hypothetical protein
LQRVHVTSLCEPSLPHIDKLVAGDARAVTVFHAHPVLRVALIVFALPLSSDPHILNVMQAQAPQKRAVV